MIKNRVVHVPLTDEEWTDLRVMAARMNSTIGATVRRALVKPPVEVRPSKGSKQ